MLGYVAQFVFERVCVYERDRFFQGTFFSSTLVDSTGVENNRRQLMHFRVDLVEIEIKSNRKKSRKRI